MTSGKGKGLSEGHRNVSAELEEWVSLLPTSVARALQPMPPPHGHSQRPPPGSRSSHLGVGQGDLGLQFLHLLLQLFLLLIHALPVTTLPLEVLLKDFHLKGRWRRREKGQC